MDIPDTDKKAPACLLPNTNPFLRRVGEYIGSRGCAFRWPVVLLLIPSGRIDLFAVEQPSPYLTSGGPHTYSTLADEHTVLWLDTQGDALFVMGTPSAPLAPLAPSSEEEACKACGVDATRPRDPPPRQQSAPDDDVKPSADVVGQYGGASSRSNATHVSATYTSGG